MILTHKLVKEIAKQSFGHVLDCVLGYSDALYTMENTGEDFIQNFEEDLQESGLSPTEKRLEKIVKEYDNMRNKFINDVRKKYY